MPRGEHQSGRWDRERVTRIVRRAVATAVGDAWELTLAVALFAVEEPRIPDRGSELWRFVEALADAVENQTTRETGDRLRQRLARELRPVLSVDRQRVSAAPTPRSPDPSEVETKPPPPMDRDATPVRSGWRSKVKTDEEDRSARTTTPAPPPDAIPPVRWVDGVDEVDEERQGSDEDDESQAG